MPTRAVQPLDRPYIMAGTLIALMAVIGFWPTYLQPLFTGASEAGQVIHFHATVYFGWLALFVAQAWLAASGRLALHMKVGRVGMIYGIAMIFVGLLVTFSQFADRVAAGNFPAAQSRLLYPFTDMLIFPAFFGAAIAYRRKPQIHKRWMIVASTYLLVAAVLRMPIIGSPRSQVLFIGIWITPIVLAMVHDYVRQRLIHPVYLIGIAALAASGYRDVIRETGMWRIFTEWLATLFV
ncbi:MAG: hypothetical protein F4053_04690 [Proteobacteria bacterium]|nr:hypothetical protein [Pseudomonadota bacterium]MYJ94898.1 hypothetical protein [Pseudomonadota bacterium]